MLFDCHIHTHLCGHAFGRPEDYVNKAAEQGIGLMTFTCHIPISGNGFLQEGIRMDLTQLSEYKHLVDRARTYGQSRGVEVLYGIEAEVFPEETLLASAQAVLDAEPFDFILGSLHHQLPIYRRWLADNGKKSDGEIITTYFQNLTQGAASGRYHSMSHPDVIRIYGTVDSFEPEEHEEVIKTFLETLVKNQVCMEVNTSGLAKGVYKVHPDPKILEWAKELGVQLTLGSDSHLPGQVGQYFPEVLTLLETIGYNCLSYFKAGKQTEVSLTEMKA